MMFKWRFFFQKKIARIAQQLGSLPPGPLSGSLFSHTQSLLSTTFKIVIAGFLNKQMLLQNATITTKPCLTIIRAFSLMVKINYLQLSLVLFEKLKSFPLKISGYAPYHSLIISPAEATLKVVESF